MGSLCHRCRRRLSFAVQVVDLCAKYIIQGACWTIERERENTGTEQGYIIIIMKWMWLDVISLVLVNVQRVLVCHKLRINVDI